MKNFIFLVTVKKCPGQLYYLLLQSLFCYTRRHFSVLISNVYLKALVECWHVHVTLEYISALQKSTQVLWVFSHFPKTIHATGNFFGLIRKNWSVRYNALPDNWYLMQCFAWFAKINVLEKQIVWSSRKLINKK